MLSFAELLPSFLFGTAHPCFGEVMWSCPAAQPETHLCFASLHVQKEDHMFGGGPAAFGAAHTFSRTAVPPSTAPDDLLLVPSLKQKIKEFEDF